MDWFGLSGKKYLVTGASSGIGQAAAIKISQLGGKVILNGRNLDRLQQTLSMMDGDGHFVMPFDLAANLKGIKEYIDTCIQTDGKQFDGMVFSTGITKDVPIRVETIEQLQKVMNVNYVSFFSLVKAFSSKRVLNDNGAIVAVSSTASRYPAKSQVSYGSSKAAVDAVCIVAAKEFAKRKVRVNSINPDMTLTPMTTSYFDRMTEQQKRARFPLGTILAEDIANTIIFLLSEMSSKITGQQIYVNSGNSDYVNLYDFQ